MLRMILGTKQQVKNGELETWLAWMKRSTRIVEEAMQTCDVPDWVEEVHRRRYRWAGKVARCKDGRWSKTLLSWSASGTRAQGRPHIRWTDRFGKFYGERSSNLFWTTLADDENFWQADVPDSFSHLTQH